MTGVMQQQQLHCTPRRGKGPTEASVEQQNANVAAGFAWDSVCGCRDGNKQTGSEQSPPQFQTGFLTVHSFIKLFQQHHPGKDCLGAKPGCFCLSLFLFFPQPAIEIYSVHVDCKVTSRFAHTVITSRIVNRANESREATFEVELPKTAFITNFSM